MKLYVISYYVEPGEAGVTGIYRKEATAKKVFEMLCRDVWCCDADLTKKDLDAKVKAALKDRFFEYPGDGCGPNPWYDLECLEIE